MSQQTLERPEIVESAAVAIYPTNAEAEKPGLKKPCGPRVSRTLWAVRQMLMNRHKRAHRREDLAIRSADKAGRG